MGASLLSIGRLRTVTIIPEVPGGLAMGFAWSFDNVQEMTETSPGQAWRHPLQNGQEGITDGTRLEPPDFQVSGLLTDTPVRSLLPTPHPGAATLYEAIKLMREQQIAVAVITSWAGVLRNRWPEVITASHGAADGASIRISINFVKFRLVSTLLVPVQADSDMALLGGIQAITVSEFTK